MLAPIVTMNYKIAMLITCLSLAAVGAFLAGLSMLITALCRWWDSHH